MEWEYLNRSESRLFVLKGILCAIFGLISILFSSFTFTFLAYCFATIALLNGLLTLVSMLYAKIAIKNLSLFHYEGVISLITGVLVVCFPDKAIGVFMSILGATAVGMGLIQIALAFDLKSYKVKEDLLIYSGILTVVLGLILFKNPASISAFINILIGIFFTTAGIYTAHFAYKAFNKTEKTEAYQPLPQGAMAVPQLSLVQEQTQRKVS